MKLTVFLIALLLVTSVPMCAQTIERKVFNTLGQSYTTGSIRMKVSAGEPIVGFRGTNVKISQGIFTGSPATASVTAIPQISESLKIAIHPNPATNTLYITSAEQNLSAQVTDLVGRTVAERAAVTESVSVAALPAGMYILHIYDQDNRIIQSSKIIKQ